MRNITDLAIFIQCVSWVITAGGDRPGRINLSVLTKCKGHGDCHPWQTCAICISSSNRPGGFLSVNYCSDFNFRGLCGYDDNELSCTCSETMNHSHRAYMSGKCTSDQQCNSVNSPGRCAICVDHFARPNDPKTFSICTDSPVVDKEYSLCAQSWCSCGQAYPDLDGEPGVWDEQRSMLNQNRINAAADLTLLASSSNPLGDPVDDQNASLQQTWSQDNRGQYNSPSLEQLGAQLDEVQFNLEPNEIQSSE